jgi:hypothetical protein
MEQLWPVGSVGQDIGGVVDGLVETVDGARLARLRAAVGDTDFANINAEEHVASVLRLLAHTPGSAKSDLRLFPLIPAQRPSDASG